MKQHYLFSCWSSDAGIQHPFHVFIWDCFPFVVNQMDFLILAPFEHFLWVSTIFWSTNMKFVIFSLIIPPISHISAYILRVTLPVSTASCTLFWFIHLLILFQHCSYFLNRFLFFLILVSISSSLLFNFLVFAFSVSFMFDTLVSDSLLVTLDFNLKLSLVTLW